jgi:hypothetical protein
MLLCFLPYSNVALGKIAGLSGWRIWQQILTNYAR